MKINLFALAVGLAALGSSSASAAQLAADDADAGKAAIRFQQGVELYREGSYEGALAEFRKAYQISPSYRVLYNIAQTQYALHDFVGAYKSLLQYMSEGGVEITVDRRAQVDDMSARLAERIGHLQIGTNLAGADIRVDDVSVGIAPLPGPVPVNVGTRKVSVVKSGYPTAVRVITVAGKETVKLELHVDEPMASQSPPAFAPGNGDRASTVLPAATAVASAPPGPPSRAPLVVAVSATAALAVGTGISAYLALHAQQQLKDDVNAYPTTKDKIESARSKSKNYGYMTDAFGAATLVSGGVALYLALTHSGDPVKAKPRTTITPVVLAPGAGGMLVQGRF